MARENVQATRSSVWNLARGQHGIVSQRQLRGLGLSEDAVDHRLAKGRLHRLHAGVYAVGWPEPTRHGAWMAAVLACGPGAVLSHASAAALYGIDSGRAALEREISISVPSPSRPRRPGLRIHRVTLTASDTTIHDRIPATSPVRTLIDLAAELPVSRLERAVNQADKLGLVDPESMRDSLADRAGQRGLPALRDLLDRDTFLLTESELERRFLPIARRAGLGEPETGVRLNGFVVDFHWEGLGLVVETDGLRYHRTALQQARDRRRDQAHAAAGLTTLRFTHRQVASEPTAVARTLAAVARRLAERAAA